MFDCVNEARFIMEGEAIGEELSTYDLMQLDLNDPNHCRTSNDT